MVVQEVYRIIGTAACLFLYNNDLALVEYYSDNLLISGYILSCMRFL